MDSVTERLSDDGFCVVPSVLSAEEADRIAAKLAEILAEPSLGRSIRRSRGQVYAARNLGHLWDGLRPLVALIREQMPIVAIMGSGACLVRAIFFDKPPGRSWSLPWHRDTMLPVKGPADPTTTVFHRAGVPHIKGDTGTLAQMLTVRLHLDAASASNGALLVAPGSHQQVGLNAAAPASQPEHVRLVAVERGDAVLMRPLLLHKSNDAVAGSREHRRVIHLEFAATETPAVGLVWADPYS